VKKLPEEASATAAAPEMEHDGGRAPPVQGLNPKALPFNEKAAEPRFPPGSRDSWAAQFATLA
jgi:hypothetical protein